MLEFAAARKVNLRPVGDLSKEGGRFSGVGPA
jgi:hypothetical protein